MAQHDFTPAWLNFPTAPSPAKPPHSCESPAQQRDLQANVNRRRHSSSDGCESGTRRPGGGPPRGQRNGWKLRNGAERPGGPQPAGEGGAGMPRSAKTRGPQERAPRDDPGRRKKFEAEDFPSLNPDAEREVNRSKAAGVWEHPPKPQSRGSRMMVIRRISREESASAPPLTAPLAQQQAPPRSVTGPALFKGPGTKSASLPVKASRSSSSSPVEQGSQPRLMMRLTRMRADRKSHFLRALRQDMVGQEELHLHCKDEESFHLQNNNVGRGDDNRNGYEHGSGGRPQENGNGKPGALSVLRSSTFPQQEALSSSLEAEHRLLKEMGWQEDSENDETCAPLTEDEMREFQAISEQLQKNGLRKNGLSLDPATTPWRTPGVNTAADATEETDTTSSSSDTSDDEA